MQHIRRILVVLGAEQFNSQPLNRAKQIATAIHAELQLLLCDSRREHGLFLQRLSAQLAAEGFHAVTRQGSCDHAHPTEAILDCLKEQPCDLVIKQHYPDHPLTPKMLTPEDWKLLRQSPVPVLLTRSDRPWNGGIVLAALDVDNLEAEHRDLQGSIISHAVDLAALIQGSLHAVCAYPDTPFSSADPCAPEHDNDARRYREACRWFQEEYQLADRQLHIAKGSAKTLIPQIAHELGVAVTVIGTVARSGLAGLLIGNTAEAVLDRLDSDVLILKPHSPAVHLLEPCEELQPAPEESRVSA